MDAWSLHRVQRLQGGIRGWRRVDYHYQILELKDLKASFHAIRIELKLRLVQSSVVLDCKWRLNQVLRREPRGALTI